MDPLLTTHSAFSCSRHGSTAPQQTIRRGTATAQDDYELGAGSFAQLAAAKPVSSGVHELRASCHALVHVHVKCDVRSGGNVYHT